MADVITESGMDFVGDNAFYIEKSSLYKKLGNGVKSVEFIRIKGDSLLFIEAKTTYPNPNNPSAENLTKFHMAIEDTCEKFLHSLNLFSSVKVGVAEFVLSDDFFALKSASLVFILVVKNHELRWCNRIRTSILNSLPLYLKNIWKPIVYVINHEAAAKRNLVVNYSLL